jgi:ribonuclease HI
MRNPTPGRAGRPSGPAEKVKITLFADGGSRGNPGPAACGAVLFDESGAAVREIGQYLGHTTNNVAEWSGLIAGLEAALDLGATEIDVRLDSELVVRQLSGQYRVKHAALVPLHGKAKTLLRRFGKTHIAHVPRARNKAADALVNQTLDAEATAARE